tara:strand:- start:2058 stop:2342 length:285 start_codon:yes stop_codon:yes gene_type:complete
MAWTKEKMVERIQIHHPHLGETEILQRLNLAKDLFCEETGIYKRQDTFTTTANKTYYTLDSDITRVDSVWLNSVKIPRLVNKPPIDDENTTTET